MSLKYRLALLLISAFITCTPILAQDKYNILKQEIDSLIVQDLPKSTLEKVYELKNISVIEKNDIYKLDAVLYELNLTAQIEKGLEKNIQILETEIESTVFPAKAILQSVLAETYWNYYKRNRHKIANRTSLEIKDNDFKNWDFKTLIKQISELYDASLSSKEILQNISINDYNIIITDNINKNLRPSLYDLLAHRALAFYNNQESHLNIFNLRKTIHEDTFFSTTIAFFMVLRR